MAKFLKWVKSIFAEQPRYDSTPAIVAMCSYRGDAIVATRDGGLYLVRDNLVEDRPMISNIGLIKVR